MSLVSVELEYCSRDLIKKKNNHHAFSTQQLSARLDKDLIKEQRKSTFQYVT